MTKRPKPTVHGRDHEHGGADPTLIHWEDVGGEGGGGGSGIQFDTYPQDGGYLYIKTDGGTVPSHGTRGLWVQSDDKIQFQVLSGSGNFDIEQDGTGDLNLYTAGGSVNISGDSGVILGGHGDTGIVLDADGNGDIVIHASGAGSVQIIVHGPSNQLVVQGLPTSDPGVAGALWNDSGTVKVSP